MPTAAMSLPEVLAAPILIDAQADVDISDPAFDVVRSIWVFEITYQQRRNKDGGWTSWGTVYMAVTVNRVTTAAGTATFPLCRKPQILTSRPVAAANGIARSLANGELM